jgi:V/A-type H+-transporting ATPase subunit K
MDIGLIGFAAAISLAAIGSALGTGIAGMAAIGAWKKCFAQNKPAPFLAVAFAGAPLTQTIYGLILMNAILASSASPVARMAVGIFGGAAIGFSALLQGKAGASASDALGETGKGFVNYLMVVGIIETVALFVMVFLMGTMG